MDFVSAVRSDILRPVIAYIIPGAFALAPYLAVTAYHVPAVPAFWNDHPAAGGVIIALLIIFLGATIENVGSRIELVWDRRLIAAGNDNWQQYLKLKLNSQDEVIAERYLNGILLRMKFELSMTVSLPLMLVGLIWANRLYEFVSWSSFSLVAVALVISVAYLTWESYQSAGLLHRTRQLVIDVVGGATDQPFDAARSPAVTPIAVTTESKFAARVFQGAGIYGLLVLLPQYLLETGIGPDLPTPITRPEHFYGFVGVALAWQFIFLLIARDVRRYRPLMLVGVLEKLAFGVPVLLLYARGRIGAVVLMFGIIDLLLGALFVLAWRATGEGAESSGTGAQPVP